MRFRSLGLNRTGTIRPLASPLGSFGRPIFGLVAFATVFVLLNDCSLHSGSRRDYGRYVQHSDMALWLRWIVSAVHPRVNFMGLRMSFQVEYLDNPIPNNLPLMTLCYWNAL